MAIIKPKGASFALSIVLHVAPDATIAPASLGAPVLSFDAHIVTVDDVQTLQDGTYRAAVKVVGDCGLTTIHAELAGITGTVDVAVDADGLELMPDPEGGQADSYLEISLVDEADHDDGHQG